MEKDVAKAKEYAQQIKNGNCSADAQSAAALKIMDEVGELIKARKCYSDGAYEAVFRELKQKWLAICRILPEVMPGVFSIAIQVCYPKLYPILVRKRVIDPRP